MVTRVLSCCVVAALAAGCKPNFGTPTSLVNDERILAVRATPAEVTPGASAAFDALVVSPSGTEAMPNLDWALCTTPKPLDENNIVSADCLGSGAGVMDVGMGATVMATIPIKACQLFGPDPPPQVVGQPPLRPRDPDITGGYYQPLRLSEGKVTGFALERITCELANAGSDLAAQFGMTYVANTNPTLDPLTATVGGDAVTFDALPAGQAIDFSVGWPAASVESYPVFDEVAGKLVTHRESMRVSWFATDGAFAHDVTGSDETDTATTTDNTWTAPTTSGPVHLWLVLRDARGGIDYAAYELTVTP
ncbi:MAG TPA: hypothetical protein VIA18_11660 [Polyangia bacterium]|nr:hypothetical protein [Polyangia bacterium]